MANERPNSGSSRPRRKKKGASAGNRSGGNRPSGNRSSGNSSSSGSGGSSNRGQSQSRSQGQSLGQGGPRGQQRKKKKRRSFGQRNGRPGRDRAELQIEPDAPLQPASGVLELNPDSNGFLRQLVNDYEAADDDVRVPSRLVRENHLSEGSFIDGQAAAAKNGMLQLREVEKADGVTLEKYHERMPFHRLTSIDPLERLRIDEPGDVSMRILDLITPVGKGQRGLIVAPPRTGKTILLQKLAQAIAVVHPDVHLMIVLIDERPEEVTEMRRTTQAEVIASSSDQMAKRHVHLAELVLERARRLVEAGRDVVLLLDSLTRMARAYNVESRGSGRTLTGGLDAKTMQKPREFFGAARNAEEGGSLTILATALIDTGSRMDQVIFEEFKGTGNMELMLHRPLADRRVWPAIDIHRSGTRKEEKLRDEETQEQVNLLRRIMADREVEGAMEALISKIEKTETNKAFLDLLTTARR